MQRATVRTGPPRIESRGHPSSARLPAPAGDTPRALCSLNRLVARGLSITRWGSQKGKVNNTRGPLRVAAQILTDYGISGTAAHA
jgi:hypothetical protein